MMSVSSLTHKLTNLCYSMILGQKLVIIMPAYNAAKTIEKTYRELPFDIVDEVILTDDYSSDNTIAVSYTHLTLPTILLV